MIDSKINKSVSFCLVSKIMFSNNAYIITKSANLLLSKQISTSSVLLQPVSFNANKLSKFPRPSGVSVAEFTWDNICKGHLWRKLGPGRSRASCGCNFKSSAVTCTVWCLNILNRTTRTKTLTFKIA